MALLKETMEIVCKRFSSVAKQIFKNLDNQSLTNAKTKKIFVNFKC